MTTDYEQAKEKLFELRREDGGLANAVRAAVAAGDAVEVARLKRRQADLPSELYTAEVMQRQANVVRLRAEVAAVQNRVDAEGARSKEIDARVVASLRVLDEERQRINQEAMGALTAKYAAQNDFQKLYSELVEAQRALSELLNKAA